MGYRSEVAYLIVFGTGLTPEQQVERLGNLTDQQKADTLHNARVIREEAKKLFYMFLSEAKVNQATMKCFDEEDDMDGGKEEGLFIDKERLLIKYYADHVKWYEDYDDVKCHTALLDMASEYILEKHNSQIEGYKSGVNTARYNTIGDLISTYFVRIGEEYNDIETDGNGGYHAAEMLGVKREIYFDM